LRRRPPARAAPSSADVATEVANISAGLGILTIPLFPFALPALLLVTVPLAIVGGLVAIPFILPLCSSGPFAESVGAAVTLLASPGRRSRRRPTPDPDYDAHANANRQSKEIRAGALRGPAAVDARPVGGRPWLVRGSVWSVPGLIVNPDFATGNSVTSERVLGVDMNGWHALSGFLVAVPALMLATRPHLVARFLPLAAGEADCDRCLGAVQHQDRRRALLLPQ